MSSPSSESRSLWAYSLREGSQSVDVDDVEDNPASVLSSASVMSIDDSLLESTKCHVRLVEFIEKSPSFTSTDVSVNGELRLDKRIAVLDWSD